MSIRELLKEKIIICDGAMGTMLQKLEAPLGKHPELLNITHPEILEDIYRQYLEAGSDFVSTNTFGANRYKLQGCGYSVEQIVEKAVAVARAAVLAQEAADRARGIQRKRYVALDISSVGRLMEPAGDLSFEEAFDIYTEQIAAGVKAGADLLLFETYTDISELRAAVLAAKECCDLPIFCSVTFQEDGRMLMGTDPMTAVNLIQDLGVEAFGVNCSLGPKQMAPVACELLSEAAVPFLMQPNAGLPRVENGQTLYDVTVEEYTQIMAELAGKGLRVAGGCCGTGPEYIRALAKALEGKRPVLAEGMQKQRTLCACSATRCVKFDGRVVVIGERINPTGKKALKAALASGDFEYVENEAVKQVEAGAQILDVNMGLPGIDERETMLTAVRRISAVTDVPLQIDSADPQVLEAAVRSYCGKAIINSVNGKKETMDAVFPIAKKYGANLVALTLDERGLPDSAEKRLEIAEGIIAEAARYGIGPERLLVDCLTLTVSAEPQAAADTLEAIGRLKDKYPVKTTLGASNVSFGLPNRRLLNASFLTAAMYAGLDAPITDPLVPEYMDAIAAFCALFGRDPNAAAYIEKYKDAPAATAPAKESAAGQGLESQLTEIIRKGWLDRAAGITEQLLRTYKPLEVVEGIVIPALAQVGEDYETGRSFLPQLIRSADTVSAAFEVLKKALADGGEEICYGRIILATVEGDIHDIGKNIVKVLLGNYGYEILDLGKDVAVETVVETARKENIAMVGLSALMTTTVANMERTIRALREAGLSCRIAVGGAVLTADYAEKIGADYYCKEAMDTVRAAEEIFKGGAKA